MPVELFDKIDTLECLILRIDLHSLSQFKPPRLADWKSVITEFGVHYNLKGFGPILVDPKIFRETSARYGI